MGKCKHYQICGLEDGLQPDGYLCILHSDEPNKSQRAFNEAFEAHRQREKGSSNFGQFVFPYQIDFSRVAFSERANFLRAVFKDGAIFDQAVFGKGANFTLSEFLGDASFADVNFAETAWFIKTHFLGTVDFWDANFSRAHFSGAKFEKDAHFGLATFSEAVRFEKTQFKAETNFSDVSFNGIVLFRDVMFSENISFSRARFLERVAFSGVIFRKDADFSGAIFSKEGEFLGTVFNEVADFTATRFIGPTVFTAINREPLFLGEARFIKAISERDALTFLEVDLSRCRFLGADVRKVQFIGALWARIGSRDGVYDEIAPLEPGQQRPWTQLEELDRELKQNYEDRRDYERAGHFHIGEKEMRLRNPRTRIDLRVLLAIYKGLSGYGENYRRPLLWLFLLLFLTSSSALIHGLTVNLGKNSILLSPNSVRDWGWALLYGFDTIFHLPANQFTTVGLGRIINSFSQVLGPVLIALFGFALRQRLKR